MRIGAQAGSGLHSNRRKSVRRVLDYTAAVVASDGTWRHKCEILDISESGAQFSIDPAFSLPPAFFLAFTESGAVGRPCLLVWRSGPNVGVRFTREPRSMKVGA
jgi:PilZ domain